jgi:hypothetical protein
VNDLDPPSGMSRKILRQVATLLNDLCSGYCGSLRGQLKKIPRIKEQSVAVQETRVVLSTGWAVAIPGPG